MIYNVSGSTNDNLWGDYVFSLMPNRMKTGYAGAYFSFLPALLADTIEIVSNNTLLAPLVKQPESPDDVLPHISKHTGIIQYFSESNTSYRERIANWWETVPYYGRENTLTGSLLESGAGNFDTVTLDFNVAGTDIAIGDIQPYPDSNTNPYQFNVIIKINSVTAVPGVDVVSALIPDKQLLSIRRIIKLIKPVDYACREILLYWTDGTVPMWGDGTEWDDGTVWPTVTDANFKSERHSYYSPLGI